MANCQDQANVKNLIFIRFFFFVCSLILSYNHFVVFFPDLVGDVEEFEMNKV